ncbi:putative RnaseH ribonuclease [Campylobacter phage F352]|uniref:Putative RnaseH ribonuclease n=4 Tax=Fletchervirus CPX TaxID=1110702 RepID=A0A7T3KHY6_9CAUD|nr:putative RnaseH ribonuclease [Campylobacter phage F348]QPX63441.1 putative RnaseH ribonuclease [Campylobacter phage F352]QPX65577.1 putative RnaseH ribonuclease [Campylobacter phage F374]QPX65744.1 putative RnaseH ribonuclease [Campylobacter phage F375]QXO06003.1 hypothetical protein [Campylobacter phage CJLB-10]
MVLIDFMHLAFKSLYVAVGKDMYSKQKLSFEKYHGMFVHLVFNYLKLVQTEYARDYGNEIVLALEGSNSWRKSYYPEYKTNRKLSDVFDWENEVFPAINEIIDVIKKSLPYKVLRVKGAEGDDIIAVLANHTVKPVLVVSEDKDFMQLLINKHITLFKPIKKEFFRNIEESEITKTLTMHILLGDKADNIPSIMEGTTFTPDFIKFLENNGIFETDVNDFNKLEISKTLYDLYSKQSEKSPFKPAYFGEVGAKRFLENLNENLEKNKLVYDNFVRNKTLIDFREIPDNIKASIIEQYNLEKPTIDLNNLLKFFLKYNCKKHSDSIASFNSNMGTSLFDDWM